MLKWAYEAQSSILIHERKLYYPTSAYFSASFASNKFFVNEQPFTEFNRLIDAAQRCALTQ